LSSRTHGLTASSVAPSPIIAADSIRLELEFEIYSERRRQNSLHWLDTLITALRVFRAGLVEESDGYDRRPLNAGPAQRPFWRSR
jgi:hypothetical protein